MAEERSRPTIYEVARRYAGCVYALSGVLGINPYEVLKNHREVCTAVFMQASREGIRISSNVEFPPIQRVVLTDWREERPHDFTDCDDLAVGRPPSSQGRHLRHHLLRDLLDLTQS